MILGIVGGIGSGKSTVTRLLVEEGCAAVDADAIAHQVLETKKTRRAVRERFGESVFNEQGSVERNKLADRVFRDPEALAMLNDIIHPEVQRTIKTAILAHRGAHPAQSTPGKENAGKTAARVLVLDVSLLVSSPLAAECDAIVFVDANLDVRRQRCQARGWAPDELERRESFQATIEKKRQLASLFIDNSRSITDTRRQIRELLRSIPCAVQGANASRDDQTTPEVEEKVPHTCQAPPEQS